MLHRSSRTTDLQGQEVSCLLNSVESQLLIPVLLVCNNLDQSRVFVVQYIALLLCIGHMIWREMYDFTEGAVLLVLASRHYTEADYIRDYGQYLQEAEEYFKREGVQK